MSGHATGQDWSSFQASRPSTTGLDFAIIKATEGTSYINPRMAAQAQHAREAGLVVGFYHFLRPGNMAAQAAYFVEKCASVAGDLLVADWETPGVSCAEKDAFLVEVKQLRPTHRVGLYVNRDYWLHRDTTSGCGDFLWIADPDHPAGHPAVQHPWAIHQYSTAGGIDHDVYNGSPAALRAWATGAAPGPDTPTPEEDDVPYRTSLGDHDQALAWGKPTRLVWPTEYGDSHHAHEAGRFPGYVSLATSWADLLVHLQVSGIDPAAGDQLQARFEVHDWVHGKSHGPVWTETHDLPVTTGAQFVSAQCAKGLVKGQHVYVAVTPFAGGGRDKAPTPRVVDARFTIAQDRS